MTIEERLEALEKKLIREKWLNRSLLLALAAVVILAGNLGARRAPGLVPEIHASELVLEDASGCSRAVLGMDKDGPMLSLRDDEGRSRAMLRLDKEGVAQISLCDELGNVLWHAPQRK